MDEKSLDQAFDLALRQSPEFVTWLLSRTKFRDRDGRYHWSRSDHPWGRIEFTVQHALTDESKTLRKDSETDILAVFESRKNGERFALHIENKLANGGFTEYQPEMYRARAEAWLGNPKYESYADFETMLIASHAFAAKHPERCSVFDRFVPHEEIARFVPEFSVE